ncbi:MAG: MFS transporter [Pseudobdellovibrio sp.]
MNKKIISWALYDWANSVFYTTVMAGFFPVFFKQYWNSGVSATISTERLGICAGISGFILAVASPTLGVISDKRRMKKKLLFYTMVLGVICTIALNFVPQGDWMSAGTLYGAALLMISASCVFYDSLLVSVCNEDQYDYVSSLGYSLGYLGGGILFAFNVLMVLKPAFFGLADAGAGVRASFVTVGVWWLLFSIPIMKNVPEPESEVSDKKILHLTVDTIKELKNIFFEIIKNKNLFYFILAYWFYIDGVFTVMSMAVDFGLALGFDSSDLMKALLITQFVGFPAAWLFGVWSKKWSSKTLIMLGLGIYIITIIAASVMSQAWHFYALAFLIGIGQGGVQALSRSLFSHLIPPEKSGEYFGFFNMLGKFASVLGPFLVAIFAHVTSDSRQTILSLLILIGAGAFFLSKVKVKVYNYDKG